MAKFWKSLATRRAPAARQDEFPEELPVGEGVRQVTRRDFFRWSGLGFAVGLATGCDTKKAEKALAYLGSQEGVTPGVDLWFATTCGGCTAACGVLAKSRDGRPVKLEGLSEHPVSRGGLCAAGQAQLRDLFDGERLRGPRLRGTDATWADLDRDLTKAFGDAKAQGGRVRVLSGSLVSPALQAAVGTFLGAFPQGRRVAYDALSLAAIPAAFERTHGQRLFPSFKLEAADLLVGIEADFLGTWIDPAGFGRAYASRRNPDGKMNRHVHIESGMTLTGSNADERIRVAPSEAVAFLEHLAAAVDHLAGTSSSSPVRGLEADAKAQVHALATALWAHRGASLVVSGLNDLHAQVFVNRLNHALGNEGKTLMLDRAGFQKQGNDQALAELVAEMQQGQVDALVMLDCNPVYDLPAELAFDKALAKVPVRVHLGRNVTETTALATHLAPDHHPLETWRDAEPVAGLRSLYQPLVTPLFKTRDAVESLLLWAGAPSPALDHLKAAWKAHVFPKAGGADFETFWLESVRKGFVEVTAAGSAPAYREDRRGTQAQWAALAAPTAAEFELLPYAKVGMQDGRHTHNPWLQELPDPVTKVTWDNYAQLSPKTAGRLKLEQGDLLRVRAKGGDLVLPVVVQPGLHDRTLAVAVGYGRTTAGKHGTKVGGNVYPLRTLAAGFLGVGGVALEVSPVPGKAVLACTQDHHLMEGRELVREMGYEAYKKDPASARPHEHPGGSASLYAPLPKGDHHWAMVVDLSKCSGCSACVISCQAENNIPVVGKDEVTRKREMHWMRIDRYYTGSEEAPGVVHQPLMCQQCDNAPCENVCPVVATVHSDEGLNQQVYNRCVGTRYCANNCPYKTRRFNWFDYDHSDPVENLALNPDVTVRSRGVMEKCSFCVQRIQQAKATAKNEGRELKDGELKTACQQSCPGLAIVFGDLKDPESEVARLVSKDPKRYAVLGELGVLPNVSYLTKIRNKEMDSHGGHHGA